MLSFTKWRPTRVDLNKLIFQNLRVCYATVLCDGEPSHSSEFLLYFAFHLVRKTRAFFNLKFFPHALTIAISGDRLQLITAGPKEKLFWVYDATALAKFLNF